VVASALTSGYCSEAMGAADKRTIIV